MAKRKYPITVWAKRPLIYTVKKGARTRVIKEFWPIGSTYNHGLKPPNYPVPAKIGQVERYYDPAYENYTIIVNDCDEGFDPQCCWIVYQIGDGETAVDTDQPSTSPNYR